MVNTSHKKLPTMQQQGAFQYLVQAQPAPLEEDCVREVYVAEHLAFELKHDLDSLMCLSFAQRRFIGFRNRYEFEKKRLVVANKHEFSVVGYDHRKHVYELLRQGVGDKANEEIRFVDFLEDS